MKSVAGRKRTCTVLSRNSFAYSYKIVISRAALIENNRVDGSSVGRKINTQSEYDESYQHQVRYLKLYVHENVNRGSTTVYNKITLSNPVQA